MDELQRGWLLLTQGEYGQADRVFRALLHDAATPPEALFQARFNLGYCCAFTGRFDEARAIYTHLRDEARAGGSGQLEHMALHQLGMVERMAGDWPAAQRCFEEERRLIAALGDDDLAVAVNAYELGLVALTLEQTAEARTHFETSLRTAQRTTDAVAVGCAHRGLGDWHAAQDHRDEATAEWAHALRAFRAAGDEQAIREVVARLDRRSPRHPG